MNYNTNKLKINSYLNIDIIMTLIILALISYSMLVIWSASGQDIHLIHNKIIQITLGIIIMISMAQISPKTYENASLLLYMISLILLISVCTFGQIIKGAQRWVNFYFIRFQPSEIFKITIPLLISRFINRNKSPLNIKYILLSLILILIPTILVAIQPDLGTAILIMVSGLFILFLGGIKWKLIIISIFCFFTSIPILWLYLMKDYQKNRITILLNPETDPLGNGYHIIQSKIAIGSGGLFGKGWLNGSQSQLEFLPERHTDFIFAVLAEEFGLIGVIILIILYASLIIRGIIIANNTNNIFCKIISIGFMLNLFIYIFINISMVIGIIPIVGVPLPIISYGGTSLIILMAEFGIIMSIHNHKKMLSKNL